MQQLSDPAPPVTADALALVAEYLVRYYRDAPNNIAAAKAAVLDIATDVRKQWEYCRAFRVVLNGSFANGDLMKFVVNSAKYDVWSDDEARDYLRQVYDETYLDQAINFDELEEERLALERLEQAPSQSDPCEAR